ncbi:MAG TPA: iron-containing redox enzyme family protein [Mycobacteriales bacterium]|nr:iron-containing redox enzyme family protein [Mycobacteriales bacterium]
MSLSQMQSYGDVPSVVDHCRATLPPPRGPVSEWVAETLSRPPGRCFAVPEAEDDPVTGDDSALALYLLYELHYRGIAGVDDDWEWAPMLLAGRAEIERRFLERLRQEVPMRDKVDDIAAALHRLTERNDGPGLASFCERDATWEQIREVCIHRSAWQLKEADPHTWALPRLGGRPKAALAEIQQGEYGDGIERDIHQNLYALTLALLNLDTRYSFYLPQLPGVTLATVNLASLFGLHRTWLPALIGHLAGFEMSSVAPMSAYSAALRRLEAPQDACHFFDVHVVADAHHARIAADGLAAGLVAQQPAAAPVVLWGAESLMWAERQFATHVLEAWREGRSSLLRSAAPEHMEIPETVLV